VTLTALLTETFTQHRPAAGEPDEYGNVAQDYAEVGTVRGRMEQRSGEERSTDQQVLVSDWVLFLHPQVAVQGRDRFSDRFGRVFEVVGPAAMRSAPARDVYVEVSLRHVESA
jgi:hypothetical protein